MKDLWEVIKRNPVSTFAVLSVTALSCFLGYMVVWQTNILSSPTWCAKALGAEKIAPGQSVQQTLETLRTCNTLLLEQVGAIAVDSHINHGAFALAMIVLFVVVIAGARASWKLTKAGFEGSIGKEEQAAQRVANAAVSEAQEVAADAKVATPPNPDYNGPAMPEPGKGT